MVVVKVVIKSTYLRKTSFFSIYPNGWNLQCNSVVVFTEKRLLILIKLNVASLPRIGGRDKPQLNHISIISKNIYHMSGKTSLIRYI